MHHLITNEQILQMRIQGKRESIDILADEVIRLRGYIEALESFKTPKYEVSPHSSVESTKTPFPFTSTAIWQPPQVDYKSYNKVSNQEGLAGAT